MVVFCDLKKKLEIVLVTDLEWRGISCALLKIVISVTLQLFGYVELFLEAFTNQIVQRHLYFNESTDTTSLLNHWSPKAQRLVLTGKGWHCTFPGIFGGTLKEMTEKHRSGNWVWYYWMLVRHVSRGSLCRLLFNFFSASFQVVIMSLVYSESCDSDYALW